MLQLTALRPFLPPFRCNIAGLARRACSGDGYSEEANSAVRGAPPAAAPRARPTSRGRCGGESPFLPTTPAQVRCCEVNPVARDGRTGSRRVTSHEAGLLVPRTRTCTCVDVRAHARGVVCALGPGRDVAGGRPARDARASGRVHAHRSRGRAPRRTRNPATALLPLPRARLLPRAPACSALCFPGVSRRPPPSDRFSEPTPPSDAPSRSSSIDPHPSSL